VHQSRLYLPRLESQPSTLLEYMLRRFPHVTSDQWLDRFERGIVTLADGAALTANTPYRPGMMVYYEREVIDEPDVLEVETVLFQNSEILVADKPHGMPVTPAGDYVRRSLLHRLRESTRNKELTPAHRLDRDTAGLVLFSLRAATRGLYHGLFLDGVVERRYLAVAALPPTEHRSWRLENRIAAGEPWFTQRISEGEVNAATQIELVESREEKGLFELTPKTGKKHQLRVHMASIGAPIEGDVLYNPSRPPQQGQPLQLLAYRLTFIDPVDGARREFVTQRSLSAW